MFEKRTTLEEQLEEVRDQIAIATDARAEARKLNGDGGEAFVRQAQRQIDRLLVKQRELEKVQAEEAEYQRLANITTPGAPKPDADQRTESVNGFVRRGDGQRATLRSDESWASHPVVARCANAERDAAVIGHHGGFGSLVRSMTTSSGSAVVPTLWASDIIDRARNYAAVIRAGAQIVPMDAKTVQIGRLTADPTAAFRAEGSTVTASDPTFDNVTLDAKTLSALVVGSMEWFQDADNVDEIVSDAVAKAIGLQLDLVSLYGSITSGAGTINLATPPNPRGVLGALNALASSNVLGGATNGTVQTTSTFWNEILDLVYTPRDNNEQVTGLIWNSKAARQYAKAYDTTGQPLRAPADVEEIPQFVSNQIPSYTQGTMTSRATDVFVGDWSQVLIGQRMELSIQTLTERYAEVGQVAILAHWRGDVQLARPRALAVYRAIQGA